MHNFASNERANRLVMLSTIAMLIGGGTASEHYLILAQQIPGNLVVLNNLAWALSALKDNRALSYAEQALKLQPDNPSLLDTYGWLLTQSGQPAKGLDLLRHAVSKEPGAAEIRWHLAATLAKSGDTAHGRQELERLLAGGATFPQEKEAQNMFKQLQGGK
jgi:Tfp pilus assembly protein PilF